MLGSQETRRAGRTVTDLGWLLVHGLPPGEAARIYAEHGWAVFPCRGKDPLTKHAFKDASADVQQIESWWRHWPSANIGWAVPAGWFALDEDPRHQGDESRRALEHQHGPLPFTLRQRTGSGGFHWIFCAPEGAEIRQGASVLGHGLDTRVGEKGYLIVAPSVHPETKLAYSWHTVTAPLPAPEWLRAALTKTEEPAPTLPLAIPAPRRPPSLAASRPQKWAEAALEKLVREVAEAPSGTRNATLNRAAYRLGRLVGGGLLDEADVRSRLRAAGLACGLPEREVDWVLR